MFPLPLPEEARPEDESQYPSTTLKKIYRHHSGFLLMPSYG